MKNKDKEYKDKFEESKKKDSVSFAEYGLLVQILAKLPAPAQLEIKKN
ncbi:MULTISPECIES: hypothetical protein [Metabacillus]|uniref:Uncharacterized protein n=1 Tax=Metabacillus hrfriensis TaxID=3048891 RepID=A0ACD4R9H4_9BACI|nr:MULTISPECIES: hypothetical protein [Metabacillus]UAL51619.1 hypothetical protein K8L98_20965 [Metabacillus dongyingensis]WHZ57133.1 hypothetical protein QLQ22_21120 [Metabacillus sp. CT-WN-B3]